MPNTSGWERRSFHCDGALEEGKQPASRGGKEKGGIGSPVSGFRFLEIRDLEKEGFPFLVEELSFVAFAVRFHRVQTEAAQRAGSADDTFALPVTISNDFPESWSASQRLRFGFATHIRI